ncbi:NADH dehydrogenase ubiquinone iron-sulfur protein 4 [Musa troglodytarum]|uniref:NADH dehydrogenase ubiquinone iron-sulfur protein 4 n=1 Tax=Musa troglodytarum TaxID=320322 RepID=A0A9E7ECJ3_9LILI|nr:NADH dehydrogenase ubiquinone iron-sulfur protein 4 [Musa troglodytarum]
MAAPLGLPGLSSDRFTLPCFASLSQARSLVLDALVEIKPGEIGIVSGVAQEHLNISDAGFECSSVVSSSSSNGSIVVIIHSPVQTAALQISGGVGKWKLSFVSTQKYHSLLLHLTA